MKWYFKQNDKNRVWLQPEDDVGKECFEVILPNNKISELKIFFFKPFQSKGDTKTEKLQNIFIDLMWMLNV